MLISNVVKEDKINKLQNEKEVLSKEKEEIEREKEKRVKNSQVSQQKEAALVAEATSNPVGAADNIIRYAIPDLPRIKFPDDPQKGRFGGKAENNGRKILAEVGKSYPDFYDVRIWVESRAPAENPLDEVIFYIHDSFSPSVFMIKPFDFIEGRG